MRIAVIRLKGKFSLSPKINSALSSLRLDMLYSCVLLPEGEAAKGMIHACKDVVSYGKVTKEDIETLLTRRGRTQDRKKLSLSKKPEEIKKLAAEIDSSDKKLSALGVYPVFFLSPPKGGFGRRKANAPFGPLGKNAEMSNLIGRMA